MYILSHVLKSLRNKALSLLLSIVRILIFVAKIVIKDNIVKFILFLELYVLSNFQVSALF